MSTARASVTVSAILNQRHYRRIASSISFIFARSTSISASVGELLVKGVSSVATPFVSAEVPPDDLADFLLVEVAEELEAINTAVRAFLFALEG